jgi:hypothetical protein
MRTLHLGQVGTVSEKPEEAHWGINIRVELGKRGDFTVLSEQSLRPTHYLHLSVMVR